jgi:ArsR family transcriptional regulator, lead/cadmium/zinc/bismuth-responsive transcriptional repressor
MQGASVIQHTQHVHDRPPTPAISDAAYVRAAGLFRAAGDEQRLRLLTLLAAGEWCVTDLAEVAQAGMSTVSQRLRVLRSEGLVTTRREGKHVFYALADDHVAEMLANALEHADEAPHSH